MNGNTRKIKAIEIDILDRMGRVIDHRIFNVNIDTGVPVNMANMDYSVNVQLHGEITKSQLGRVQIQGPYQ